MDTNETNGHNLASACREAIQREKQLYQKERENEPTFEFIAPSGAKFILRNPKLQTFQLGGAMPFSLTSKMLEAMGKGGGELTAMPELTQEEQFKNIISAVDLVLDIVVAPRIVETVENPDEEISQDEILMKDFQALVEWGRNGGAGAKTIESFRDRSRPNAGNRANGKKHRHKSK